MRTLPRFGVDFQLYGSTTKQASRVYLLMASFMSEMSAFIVLPCENW